MTRHSFIQMSKLSNVKGRISYITSPARQENLYATYNTADAAFWTSLARENQQEFKRSGTKGTCIEAREFIIALPEKFTRYDPQRVLAKFTEEFQKRYNVECVSGLHHNKAKMAEWERKVQERQRPAVKERSPEPRSVRERLRRLQDEGRQRQPQPRRRVVDRDSR